MLEAKLFQVLNCNFGSEFAFVLANINVQSESAKIFGITCVCQKKLYLCNANEKCKSITHKKAEKKSKPRTTQRLAEAQKEQKKWILRLCSTHFHCQSRSRIT